MSFLKKRSFYLVVTVLLMVLLVSCSSGSTPDVSSSSNVSQDTEAEQVDQEQVSEESDVQTVESSEIEPVKQELPEDIPIPPGYRKLLITKDASNISFEVDGTIDEVVTFYQQELTNLGWEMDRSPDSVFAAFGSIARIMENGDRITISLQYNPVGEFVVVRLVILRVTE